MGKRKEKKKRGAIGTWGWGGERGEERGEREGEGIRNGSLGMQNIILAKMVLRMAIEIFKCINF